MLPIVVAGLFLAVAATIVYRAGFNLTGTTILGTNKSVESRYAAAKPSVFKDAAKTIYLPPIKIQFKEKVLEVEEIGVEEGGFLGVPTTWYTAGWYKDGPKPGEEGNVIVDGHYDTNTGAPGAFWELKDLQVGDRVLLTDKLGRVFEYFVNGKSFISINDPERSKVFDGTKDRALTLITCGGVWDYKSSTYDKRLVITAVFDKMEKSW
jgi:LPXTG-site transpeptidase (sortase) family protein